MSTVYLNGKFLPQSEAKISVLDRGFLFGDGIYEVIPVYNNKFFRLEQHLKRLRRSLAEVEITVDFTDLHWEKLFSQILQHNADFGEFQLMYLQITRGAATTRLHTYDDDLNPTIYITSKALHFPNKSDLADGKSAITSEDIRWHRCDIKAISLLANVLLMQQAKHQDANDAILLRDNYVTEGGSSNVFIVKDKEIITPPLGPDILGGVTRDLVIELAKRHDMSLNQRRIHRNELFAADEVWITSSTREVFPITKLDNISIGNGKPGPLWNQMFDHYQHYIKTF